VFLCLVVRKEAAGTKDDVFLKMRVRTGSHKLVTDIRWLCRRLQRSIFKDLE